MTNNTPKPCPWCHKLNWRIVEDKNTSALQRECSSCGVRGPRSDIKEAAIDGFDEMTDRPLDDKIREVLRPLAKIHKERMCPGIGPRMPASMYDLCRKAALLLAKMEG